MRRLFAVLIAAMMMVGICLPAYAAETKGSITVNDAIEGQTYTVYRILDLESYDSTSGAHSYKATDAWSGFINGSDVKGVYVTVNDAGYVDWKEGADAAAFAQLAQVYAKANSLSDQGSVEANSSTISFTNLDLGYYLIDTSLGVLCSLDTTNPDVEMFEKNEAPTVEKQVQKSTASIGDTVNYEITVHAKPGAQGYIIHDKMSDGLTFAGVSSVSAGGNPLTEGTDYSVSTANLCADCDFHISFAQTYLNSINANTDIVVTYAATLNESAVIFSSSNLNSAKLNYGENSSFDTEWVEASVYSFKFDIVKTDSNNIVLNGAQFDLYDAETGGNKINLIKVSDGVYRPATSIEANADGYLSAVISAGHATIQGLGAGTYYLQEIAAPAGYNKITSRTAVAISAGNLSAVVDGGVYQSGGVQIINQSGVELPSTGGMGTTILYAIGAALVVGAAVLLVVRRRVRDIKE